MPESLPFSHLLIWSNAFNSTGSETHKNESERLQSALRKMRENAKPLGKMISESLPGFTVHDSTHSDALWEMVERIVEDPPFDKKHPKPSFLTPPEAFVLGAAFVIHDLGMGLAAHPGGLEELRAHPSWQDAIAKALRKKLGRVPTTEEKTGADKEIEKVATEQLLRLLHAEHAERLATVSWGPEGNRVYLLEDAELREKYGEIIGKIAHSHWWSVNELTHKLPVEPRNPPGNFHPAWKVDAIKLACLIRTADFAHLDDRRAPFYERVFRQPQGEAGEHWTFQGKLGTPTPQDNRLLYTAHSAFTREQIGAWWLCHDTLRDLDQQLREVDALLADTKRQRFQMRGVVGVESPERLAEKIETRGWSPVDARVKVGNVAALVRHLGGEQLYGDNTIVPLRELIQNACDAVRARRKLENRADDWGDVTVRVGTDERGEWIEVEDNGVGMSQSVLTGPFLDFGSSFWGSDLMQSELPGLESSGFESTGRFGIGFFSIFMWGDRVKVTTRRYEKGQDDTLVLEFGEGGVGDRPVLRKADREERMLQEGTRVRVWPRKERFLDHLLGNSKVFGLKFGDSGEITSLVRLSAWLFPSLDTNLWISDFRSLGVQSIKAVGASDWVDLDGSQFLYRLAGGEHRFDEEEKKELMPLVASNLQVVRDKIGVPVGRVVVFNGNRFSRRGFGSRIGDEMGAVSVGGIRSCGLTGICGILLGIPTRASREVGVPIIGLEELSEWASEQAKMISSFTKEKKRKSSDGSGFGKTEKLPAKCVLLESRCRGCFSNNLARPH